MTFYVRSSVLPRKPHKKCGIVSLTFGPFVLLTTPLYGLDYSHMQPHNRAFQMDANVANSDCILLRFVRNLVSSGWASLATWVEMREVRPSRCMSYLDY